MSTSVNLDPLPLSKILPAPDEVDQARQDQEQRRGLEQADAILAQSLDDGTAWTKFVEWITAQGGDPAVLHDPDLLPQAPLVEIVPAPQSGYIAALDAIEVGLTSVMLGGLCLERRVGDDSSAHPQDYWLRNTALLRTQSVN